MKILYSFIYMLIGGFLAWIYIIYHVKKKLKADYQNKIDHIEHKTGEKITIAKKEEIIALSKKYNWQLHEYQENIQMLSFIRIIFPRRARINIYLTTGTVGTIIEHPKKGSKQLFRKKVDMNLLRHIFRNPRTHTGKGYYTKND